MQSLITKLDHYKDSLQAFFSFSIPFNMHILTEVSTGVDVSYNLFSIIKSLKGLLQINKQLNSDATFKVNNPFHGYSLSTPALRPYNASSKITKCKEALKNVQFQFKTLKLNITEIIFASCKLQVLEIVPSFSRMLLSATMNIFVAYVVIMEVETEKENELTTSEVVRIQNPKRKE